MCENERPNEDLTGKCDSGSLYAEGGNYGGVSLKRPLEPRVHTGNITEGLELMEKRARYALGKPIFNDFIAGVFVMDGFLKGRYFAPPSDYQGERRD